MSTLKKTTDKLYHINLCLVSLAMGRNQTKTPLVILDTVCLVRLNVEKNIAMTAMNDFCHKILTFQ